MEVINILKEIYYKLFKTLSDPKILTFLLLIMISAPIYPIAYPILILIWWYNKKRQARRSGGFWYRQPINSKEYGLIKNPTDVHPNIEAMQLNEDESWWLLEKYDKRKIRELKNFLNNNYQKDLVITSEYLQWLIQNKGGFVIGICKRDGNADGENNENGRLVATIGGFPLEIKISDDVLRGYYIDILCVDRECRKNGYAVKLMEKMIEKWRVSSRSVMLFKLDDINIGCPEDFKFNYYLIDKSKIKLDGQDGDFQLYPINHQNVADAYQYFQKHMLRYPIHEQMSLSQFQNWILGSNILTESFLIKKTCGDGEDKEDRENRENQIEGFVNLIKSKYRLKGKEGENGNDKIVPVIDIIYLLGNKKEIMPLILQKYRRCRYFITLDLADHQDIIQEYDAEKLYSTKYYFYNYELLNKFKNTDIGIHRF